MTKKKTTSCVVQSVDSILTFQTEPTVTGDQILQLVLQYYHIHESRWFALVHYDPQCQEKRLDMKKQIRLKDIQTYPVSSVMFRLEVVLYPITSSDEIIQDSTRILLFKFELQRSMNDHEYHILPEWRALLAVSFARLTQMENSSRSAKSTIEKHFDKLAPQPILKKYGLTREQMMNIIDQLLEDTLSIPCIELVQQALKYLETSPLHGVKYFPIRNKKGTRLHLGIDPMGIVVCQQTNRLNPLIVFNWSEIKNLTKSAKKLQIKPENKDDPVLEFEAINAAHNDTIFLTHIENYKYYLECLSAKGSSNLSNEKARKAQELEESKRRAELEAQITEETYRAHVETIVKEGSVTDKDVIVLEEEFLKVKSAMEKQIVETTNQIELEAAEYKEPKDLHPTKHKASEINKNETPTVLTEGELGVVESKNTKVGELKAKLEQLSLQHVQDLKRVEAVKEASSSVSEEIKLHKAETVTKKSSLESEDKRREKIDASIKNLGKSTESKVDQDAEIQNLRKLSESGGNKFNALDKLRLKNNIRSRIDLFESL